MTPDPARSGRISDAPSTRYVTHPETARSERSARWNHTAERNDPEQRFFVYRLCPCDECEGGRTENGERCSVCRGEGRTLDLVATAPTDQAVGIALVQLGREGEFDECPCGILDTQPEPGQSKWLLKPWLPSPRNISDAGRVLRSAQTGKGKPQ